ncbi:MAG: hypothetical protein K1W05_05385 [Desulfovibrio sp.]
MSQNRLSIEAAMSRIFDSAVPTVGAQALAKIVMELLCENHGSVTSSQISIRISHLLEAAHKNNDIELYSTTMLALQFEQSYSDLMYSLLPRNSDNF